MFGSRHSCLEFQFCVGVRTLALCVLSRCVSVRSRVRSAARSSVHVCFVVLHAVHVLSAAYIHVMSFAVWHAVCAFHWMHAFMLSCVNTWLMSILISCVFMSCVAHGW